MAVKLRQPIEIPAPNGESHPDPRAASPVIPLRPLAVQAICVTKAALIDALRPYVELADIQVLDDGDDERFLLILASPGERPDGAASSP